jgi:hypothetical protein
MWGGHGVVKGRIWGCPMDTPISFPVVTSTHERCDLFADMDTLPLPQYPDCCACRINFDFPCFATPCMECGLWFHNECVDGHKCESDTDDDHANDEDIEYEDTPNDVAFPAEDQKVFAAP